jgi:hypothetical protein
MESIIYVVKGGIPNVADSTNVNFYALCYDFYSNIGYIENKAPNKWRLYTRLSSLSKENNQFEEDDKYYFDGIGFEECMNKLQEISGKAIKIIERREAEEILKTKSSKEKSQ